MTYTRYAWTWTTSPIPNLELQSNHSKPDCFDVWAYVVRDCNSNNKDNVMGTDFILLASQVGIVWLPSQDTYKAEYGFIEANQVLETNYSILTTNTFNQNVSLVITTPGLPEDFATDLWANNFNIKICHLNDEVGATGQPSAIDYVGTLWQLMTLQFPGLQSNPFLSILIGVAIWSESDRGSVDMVKGIRRVIWKRGLPWKEITIYLLGFITALVIS